jgi:Rrf2 family transcriptional regulator, iron-sulfur cluster assembly transcription factor
MIFSRSDEYAIRAMTFLARLPAGKLAGAREIAETEQIPMQFLWKILQTLAKKKLIRSFKGLRGGYELAQPAEKITIHMVLQANNGAGRLHGCVLGLPECSQDHACPLHEKWSAMRAGLVDMLESNTLADLATVSKEAIAHA